MRKIIQVVVNEVKKEEIDMAAEACGLSLSSFLKMAAKEKMSRMGIQVNADQSNRLNSPASSDPIKEGGAYAKV